MEELIRITDQNGQRVVSARELHSFLESKKDFSSWIKQRINKYDLVEGQDYTSFTQKGEREIGGTTLIQYALTLEAAKELSMVEGNAQGKKARQYFIACEKKLTQVKLPTPVELAQMFIESEQEKERQRIRAERAETVIELQSAELKEAAPAVEYVKEVLSSQSTYNTNLIAKELGMSAVTLNRVLADRGIQYKQGETWVLYHKFQDKGYTKTKTHSYTSVYGVTKTSMQTVWTETGRKFIHGLIKQPLAVQA